jgi:hypothetical protein
MPAFSDALAPDEMQAILVHIRTFCANKDWPAGELNLPRALAATKAFPEDELVLTNSFRTEGRANISNKLIYEQRIGPRNQVEVILPFGWSETTQSDGSTEWESSVGDIGVAFKRVMHHSKQAGRILSLGAELFLPTGNEDKGFGSGTTVFEPYLAYGQLLPAEFFFQFHGGFAVPFERHKIDDEAFWRGALGHTFTTGTYGRAWSPMVEVTGSKELASGTTTNWDMIPQCQVTLSTRQHIRFAAGVKLPLNDTDERKTVYLMYLLWDWFDGAFYEGW